MKPLALIAVTAAGLMGTSTMAGEKPMSFDGVGSMVLDMADEPQQLSQDSTDTDAKGCEARQDAPEAKDASPRKEVRTKTSMKEQAFAAMQMAELKVAFKVVHTDRAEAVAFKREAAILQARAALEARREELKARLASLDDHHERQAVERVEKALRRAQEAMVP